MREIKQIIETDLWLLKEAQKILGRNDDEKYAEIFEIISKLKYESVKVFYESKKIQLLTNGEISANELLKIEKKFGEIINIHANLSIIISLNRHKIKTQKVKIEKIVEETKNYKFPDKKIINLSDYFSKVSNEKIPIFIGKNNNGCKIADLTKMPH
jgi:hypothetical protein